MFVRGCLVARNSTRLGHRAAHSVALLELPLCDQNTLFSGLVKLHASPNRGLGLAAVHETHATGIVMAHVYRLRRYAAFSTSISFRRRRRRRRR